MPYAHKNTTSPATICAAIALGILSFAVAFVLLAPKTAHGAERNSCSSVAKATKKTPIEPATVKKTPKRAMPAVTITYEGDKKPVSFDSKGNATYHEGMIPVMKAVNLPDLPDTGLATKREATVEGHIIMRIVAAVDED